MATTTQFSVSWDAYQGNICSGFTEFQQNGEFVDMTIAADGHIVKVHKALIALASPYLKEIIRSTSANQHPIIFLNNVDYNTLCQLLEYIYTGEVMVPMDGLDTFLEIGRSLNIRGLENVKDIRHRRQTVVVSPRETSTKAHAPVIIKSSRIVKKIATPVMAKKEPESASKLDVSSQPLTEIDVSYEMDTTCDDAAADMDDTDNELESQRQLSESPTITPTKKPSKKAKGVVSANMQFTLSTRGSLQMILNRYLYNLQWKSRTNTRRWRCVDYRHSRCQAFVTTRDKQILDRGHLHTHGFHDKKILTKLESNSVFAALDDMEGLKITNDKNEPNDDSEIFADT